MRALPRTHERQYQIVAPEVAQIQTNTNPCTPPKRAPESILKKIAPGIANVWRKIYRHQNAAITS